MIAPTITCCDCGAVVARLTSLHRRCRACRIARDLERAWPRRGECVECGIAISRRCSAHVRCRECARERQAQQNQRAYRRYADGPRAARGGRGGPRGPRGPATGGRVPSATHALVPDLATGREAVRPITVLGAVRVIAIHAGCALRLVRVQVEGEPRPRDLCWERLCPAGSACAAE